MFNENVFKNDIFDVVHIAAWQKSLLQIILSQRFKSGHSSVSEYRLTNNQYTKTGCLFNRSNCRFKLRHGMLKNKITASICVHNSSRERELKR